MRSVTPMRAAKTGYIIMSVLLCVLGVVLFVWPGVSVAVIGELLGSYQTDTEVYHHALIICL